jgi:hypothetical protein
MKYFPCFQIGEEVKITKDGNSNGISIPFRKGEIVKVEEIFSDEDDNGKYHELYKVSAADGVWFIVDIEYLTKGE